MTFASYEQWSDLIHVKVLNDDGLVETAINRANGSIAHQSSRPYVADATPSMYAECFKELGYKEIAGFEYEAEIRAIEGQEQLVAEHIEEIERGTAA